MSWEDEDFDIEIPSVPTITLENKPEITTELVYDESKEDKREIVY